MTVEISPIGLNCNLRCEYCCAEPARRFNCKFDLDTALKQFESTKADHFGIHGGEPLLTPIDVFTKLCDTGKCSGIQTNLLLLTDKHIDLFKKYKMSIGVSIDGPGELNRLRCDEKQTELITKNIWKLRNEGINIAIASVISSIHVDKYGEYSEWLNELGQIGIKWYKTHFVQPESEYRIDPARLYEFLVYLIGDLRPDNIDNEFFRDMYNNLRGDISRSYCCWKGCDPYCTSAVDGIYGNGEIYPCERMTKDGALWIKAKQINPTIRSRALLQTECKDCKYFAICQGFCPGTALDWRKKSYYCWTIYHLYEYMENELKSLHVPTITEYPSLLMPTQNRDHGDSPHQNEHGDHTNTARVR